MRAQAAQLQRFLAGAPELDVADVARSLTARAALEQRAVVIGENREQLSEGLVALAEGQAAGNVRRGAVVDGRTAFLFTGQGAQRVGMGRECYAVFGVFAAAFDEVCAHLDPEVGCALREVVFGEDEPAGPGARRDALDGTAPALPANEGTGGSALDGTELAQPALFALEVALYRLVETWGVRPDFVIGHSVGELAAAHVAGVFSLQDACRLVAARGRLMAALPQGGAMAAIAASEEEASESLAALDGWQERVAVAAVNAPRSVVVSGDEDAVLELVGVWESRGRRTKRLRVSHAFHSPRMEGMLEEFGRVAEAVSFSEPRIPLVSNLSGGLAATEELCTAAYWVRHVREPVRFADGVRWLRGEGVASFLELGPDGVLSAIVEECVDAELDAAELGAAELDAAELGAAERDAAEPDAAEPDAAELDAGEETPRAQPPRERRAGASPVVATPLLRAGQAEDRALVGGLAEAWVRGANVDWGALCGSPASPGDRRVRLPTYAFQRERYWQTPASGRTPAPSVRPRWRIRCWAPRSMLADGEGWLFTGRLSLEAHPWLADHVVSGAVLLPGTAFSSWRCTPVSSWGVGGCES